MAICGRCKVPGCGGDTVDYVCPDCQGAEIERLEAKIEQLEKSLAEARTALGVHSGKVLAYGLGQQEQDALTRAIRDVDGPAEAEKGGVDGT